MIFARPGDSPPEAGSSPSPRESPSPSPSPTPEVTDPPAPPGPSPVPPGTRDFAVWEGPDDAVTTYFSERCQREVLTFGQQQYAPGGMVDEVPAEAEDLEYRQGERRLWGNRGSPQVLYMTTDDRTFQEWFAVEESC